MNDEIKTYKYCAVQLNLFSLLKITGLIGLGGGLSWAVFISTLDILGLIQLDRFDNYLVNIIAFPLMAAFFGMLFSFVGYPIYAWVCKNNQGQKLAGIFHNPHT
jgi:hypothetical protein